MALLEEQPRQGQEIITALGDRIGGRCNASPVLVYPNLMLLEDMGLVSVVTATDGRRLFALTEQGSASVRVAVAEGVCGGRPRGGLGNGRHCRRHGVAAAGEGVFAGA